MVFTTNFLLAISAGVRNSREEDLTLDKKVPMEEAEKKMNRTASKIFQQM